MKELRLILIGRSGHGKSATGNTILQEQKFKTCVSSTAVTSKTSLQEVIYNNYKLKIIDTPGYFDINSPDDEMYEWMKTETIKSIALSVPGPNAFLYVMKVGRYTEEDIQTMEKIFKIYGQSMKDYIIFIFTHFDDIKEDYDTIDEFVSNLPPPLLNIIHECGNRVLGIDNRYSSMDEKSTFMRQLIATLEATEGKHYTNEALKETTLSIGEKVEELIKTENISKEMAIKAVFNDIQTEGTFFKVLKEKKYGLLASFATTLLSVWCFGPAGLAVGILTFAGWATYNCKKKNECRLM